jgi:hypothetical protein
MKFKEFSTEKSLNDFLEKNNIKIISITRTSLSEQTPYGDNHWIDTALFYMEN